MEDTHIITPYLTKDQSLFAVFDGHGGSHVSEYAKDRFSDNFHRLKNFDSDEPNTLLVRNRIAPNDRSNLVKEFLRERFMDLDQELVNLDASG